MMDRVGQRRFARVWANCAWLFRSLTENLEQCVYVLDQDGRCIAANDAFCRWLKRPQMEILGRPVVDFWPQPLSEREVAGHECILRGEQIELLEEKRPRGRQTSLVHIRKAPLRDAEGNVRGVLCLLREVRDEPAALPCFQSLMEKTILVVEPDTSIARLATTLLSQRGFRVLSSEDGRRAVELFRRKPGEIDLVIVEENLPGRSGLELMNDLLAINPRLAFVLVSGFGSPPPSWGASTPSLSFLSKPYTPDQLMQSVWSALATKTSEEELD
jgi:PAS domain S-box-containing protein